MFIVYLVSCHHRQPVNDRHVSHRMASGQQHGIHQKASVVSKFAGPKPSGPPFLDSMMEAYYKLHKAQVNHRTQRSVAGDLRQPVTGTHQQGC